MSCPTCGHTMHGVTESFFWCPRCGTIKSESQFNDSEAPGIVKRCREFEKTLDPSWGVLWRTLGIAESINLPENRK